MDDRKRYRGICPQCGKELWICPSIFMCMGMNMGRGQCIGCGIRLAIRFNAERQEMDLDPEPQMK